MTANRTPQRTQPVTCHGCEHSIAMTGVPQFDYTGQQFFCGYETPLDSNQPGEVIGLSNFRPEWCPVKVELVQKELCIMVGGVDSDTQGNGGQIPRASLGPDYGPE